MKYSTFDAHLIASRPETYTADRNFTDAVMKAITQPEIFTSQIRKMSVNKKETFFMKLQHLPKLVIVAIAIGTVLVLSGTAYATYHLLWPKPEATISNPSTSNSGRREVSLLFSSCGKDITPEKYELKRDAPITEEQIEGVVKAQCELQAINQWALDTYGPKSDDMTVVDSRTQADRYPIVSMARQISKIDNSSITFAGLEKYNTPETTLAAEKVLYIANGAEIPADTFKPGDTVAYVARQSTRQTPPEECTTDACREYGEYFVDEKLVAVVKLDRAFEEYDQLAWQSLTELSECMGNEKDLCLGGYSGSIDLYTNRQSKGLPSNVVTKEIQGVITEMRGSTFILKSTSGSLYTITTPSDILTDYNVNRAAGYNNQKIKEGTTLSVRYTEDKDESGKTIVADNLFTITVKLEMVRKGDAPVFY